ncbi:HIT family protein [Frateuria hangzhouensis]|uniref:HIT family protein n=1 Tax=Frateuria hangzhouensis TaxID=2995589 RepID=UPI002260AADB|nr:HIT family protein [Frateuria sp. STR12]MCX7514413.1 HIT family protein [Frateuria sp. STR12]
MSKWNSPTAWSSLLDGSACPICVRGHPLDILETMGSAWLTMSEDAPMPGYVCLVSRVHAVELHDLSEAQAAAFMSDARQVARALSVATGAVKLNYEIHGNTLPHLHMHFFPRYPGDPFEGGAIEPRRVQQPVYAPGQFSDIRTRLLAALRSGRSFRTDGIGGA